jgi:hypothetical protein
MQSTIFGGSATTTIPLSRLTSPRGAVHILAMTTVDLKRFVVTCALVPDLYCPGYSSADALSKEANRCEPLPGSRH